MKNLKKPNNGYSYTLEDDKLREFLKCSREQRFDWLLKMHRFLRRFMPEESRAIWQKFRKGEI